MEKQHKLLEVSHLSVSFHTYAGEVQAVRDVSFDVQKGETLAIVGESGCGKSVTAKALMGLIAEPPGEIKKGSQVRFDGSDILTFDEDAWSDFRGGQAAMIFQDALAALNPTLTVGRQIAENLIIHKKLTKARAMEKAVDILSMVGIPQPDQRVKQYPHEFSGGMRQRVMIGIAIACQPRLLIADEPTTALDVTIQAQILELLDSLKKQSGTSVVLITHDLGIVAGYADRIVVMYGGKIVESGASRDIFYHPRHPYTWALLGAVPRLDTNEKKKLYAIEGMPPDLTDPPLGCPFSTRCGYCMGACVKAMPPKTSFGGAHEFRCWLSHPDADRSGLPYEMEVRP